MEVILSLRTLGRRYNDNPAVKRCDVREDTPKVPYR